MRPPPFRQVATFSSGQVQFPARDRGALSPRFKDQIERSFGRPPEAFEATSRHHFTQAFFPGLCTQGQPHFLRE
jgi:hypothetical protein